MKRFENKVVIITGSARGIGFEIAESFAKEGARIVLTDIQESEVRRASDELVQTSGLECIPIKADVSISDDCQKVADIAVEKFGKIDILVNNAGITKDNLLMRMSEKDWNEVIDVNLKGCFLMSKAVSRTMLKQKYGRIINISSVVGQMGNAGQSNYSASKAGIIGLTKSMAREFASRNILVNAVAPGFILTKMTESMKDESKAKLLEMIPLARFGEPKEVANLVLFLASEESSYITGQIIGVNGGMYM